ncbi:MAG: hypothetical protein ACOCQL_04495 [Halolamina sp.]
MVPDTAADDATEADENADQEGSLFGRWWQHFLDLFEFVLDLF